MNIGYARVSTDDQNLDMQREALAAAGCDHIFEDRMSGASLNRPGLKKALRACKPDDVLIVWKIDRLGRSLVDLVAVVDRLQARGVGVRVLTGHGGGLIDTTRPEGRFILGLFAALAELERGMIRERTIAGMQSARRRGVHLGRPTKLTGDQIALAHAQVAGNARTLIDIAATFGVHPSTLKRALARHAAA